MICAVYQYPVSGIPVGRILQRVLASKGVSQKIAAITCGGAGYEATFSRGVAGLGPLDLHALVNLNARTLAKLFRLILTAKLAQEEAELFNERKGA